MSNRTVSFVAAGVVERRMLPVAVPDTTGTVDPAADVTVVPFIRVGPPVTATFIWSPVEVAVYSAVEPAVTVMSAASHAGDEPVYFTR